LRAYRDGVASGTTATDSATIGNAGYKIIIGASEPSGTIPTEDTTIDNFVVSGSCKYPNGTTFDVPTSQIMPGAPANFMNNFDNTSTFTFPDTYGGGNGAATIMGAVSAWGSVAGRFNIFNAAGTLISDTQTAPAATTEVSGVMLYKDNVGTATLGTDLKIYMTANLQGSTPNWTGTNWTDVGDTGGDGGGYGTAQTFSGTTKQVKLGKTTVTSGTQVAMKGVWANQAQGVTGVGLYQDSSSNAHTVTAHGNATTNTSIKRIGTTSLDFSSSGSYFSLPDHNVFDPGTGDFTFEAWVYRTTTQNSCKIYGSYGWPSGGGYVDWIIDACCGGNHNLRFSVHAGSGFSVSSSAAMTLNGWTHIAVTRASNTVRLFINGTLDGSGTCSDNLQSQGTPFIGHKPANTGDEWRGYMDEIRVSNIARYTASFTNFGQGGGTISNPTAFTSDGNTALLIHGDATTGVTGRDTQLHGWAVNY
jgi:hypothetical protein